jgi:hypothetical protein
VAVDNLEIRATEIAKGDMALDFMADVDMQPLSIQWDMVLI